MIEWFTNDSHQGCLCLGLDLNLKDNEDSETLPFFAEKWPFLKLKSAPFLWKVPFCFEKKGHLREENKLALFCWKVPFLFEKKGLLRGGKRPFYAENCLFISWKVPFFTVEKCPFSLKSALLFEKKGLLWEKLFLPFYAEKCPFLKLKSALFLWKVPSSLWKKGL